MSKAIDYEPSQPIQIPDLELEENRGELNEVVMSGKKPLFERRMDGLVVNVQESCQRQAGQGPTYWKDRGGFPSTNSRAVLHLMARPG